MTLLEEDVADVCKILSNEVSQLYRSAAVQTAYEAFTVLSHSIMLDSGFIPKGVTKEAEHECMPENWNRKVPYKLFYSHSHCPSFTCCVTFIPLYHNISIQGTLSDVDCPQSVDITIQMNDYLKVKKKISGEIEDFKNLNDLSRYFKDGFCLPLLNLVCETAGYSRLFGLRGMVDELKIYLLKFLPLKDVVSMSAVNKKFNVLANLPELWKFLFIRDFTKGGVPDLPDSSLPCFDWKQQYKQEYLKRKRRSRRERRYNLYPFHMDLEDDGYLFTEFSRILDPFHPSNLSRPVLPSFPPYFRRLI